MDSQDTTERLDSACYSGQVIYIYAFDLAYELNCARLGTVLGLPTQEYALGPSKRSPRQIFFYRPEMVHLPQQELAGPHGVVTVQRVAKLLRRNSLTLTGQ